ncbi:MAG: 50S ribosomal protein L23 [Patescibacteria group bacterium]|nr:50S ribosomal protein L23 [Patescibacteria group bacterium]
MSVLDFFKRRRETEKRRSAEKEKKREEKNSLNRNQSDREDKKEKDLRIVGKTKYFFAKDILLAPVLTEKSRDLLKLNKYIFKVQPKANRKEVREAVEKIFNVQVEKVNILKLNKRVRGRLKIPSIRPLTKKALITLKPDNRISIFD